MKSNNFKNILSDHADYLLSGDDLSEDLAARYPESPAELVELLRLAGAVKNALLPVPAPAPMRETLARKLLAAESPAITIKSSHNPAGVIWLAAAGSLLSVLGLLLWLLRRNRSLDMPGELLAAGSQDGVLLAAE